MSDALKKKCSMLLTAITIADKDPSSYTVGDVTVNMSGRIGRWSAEVTRIIATATASRATVKSSSYQHIDEDGRYTV